VRKEAIMSSSSFRFIHASDFHLERPLAGLSEVPKALRDALIEAPFAAARRVFDAAMAERVDFVVLSGDLVCPTAASPYALDMLLQQFERITAAGISVYWAGGHVDSPDVWPAALALPDAVHVFPQGRVAQFLHHRGDEPLASILGLSRDHKHYLPASEFRPDEGGLFTIGVGNGTLDEVAISKRRVNYWALGGQSQRSTTSSLPYLAHYPGTPQGRDAKATGQHGCTLVQVDESGRARTSLIPCDAARWHAEQLHVSATSRLDELTRDMRQRTQAISQSSGECVDLIGWQFTGDGVLIDHLRRDEAQSLVRQLRSDQGETSSAAWTVSVNMPPSGELPSSWYEQDTMLGEFLRTVQTAQDDPDYELDLEPYLSERHLAGSIGEAVAVTDEATREQVLREAALVGAELLGGYETTPQREEGAA
jgi:hypothetical protein